MPTLRELRLQRYLTQEELAERAGVVQETIASWELGRKQPRLRSIRKLAEALGLPPAEVDWAINVTRQREADPTPRRPRGESTGPRQATSFSTWLSQQMERQRIGASQLARAIGVSHVTVVNWRAGRCEPGPATAGRLADYFNTPAEAVIKLTKHGGEPERPSAGNLPTRSTA